VHLVLLGDSIFDNASYVPAGHAVINHLRDAMPAGGVATLGAVDGAVVDDVHAQLKRIPSTATHLFLSAGGNDALGYYGMLEERAASMAAALTRLADIQEQFEKRYTKLVAALGKLDLPLTVCTIYNGRILEPVVQRLARTALIVFNDVITRTAIAEEANLIELRQLCNEKADYANDIEPSSQGGRKIAGAIARMATGQISTRATGG
jgi:lysophospholipase L1-like esterase